MKILLLRNPEKSPSKKDSNRLCRLVFKNLWIQTNLCIIVFQKCFTRNQDEQCHQVGQDHNAVEHIGHIPNEVYLTGQARTDDDEDTYEDPIRGNPLVAKQIADIGLPEVVPADDGGKSKEAQADGKEDRTAVAECASEGFRVTAAACSRLHVPVTRMIRAVAVRANNVSINTPTIAQDPVARECLT